MGGDCFGKGVYYKKYCHYNAVDFSHVSREVFEMMILAFCIKSIFRSYLFLFSVFIYTHEVLGTDTLEILIHALKFLLYSLY